MKAYGYAIVVFSLAFVAIGITLIAVTAAHGGGVVGFVLGALFVVLGSARLTLARRRG
jgi:hypothetical protein